MKSIQRIAIAASIIALSACSEESTSKLERSPDEVVVARVGNETLTVGEFKAAMAYRRVGNSEEGKAALLEELVNRLQLLHKAKMLGLDKDVDYIRRTEDILVGKMRENHRKEQVPLAVTESELQEYYNAHLDDYRVPARVRAAKIFVATPSSMRPEVRAKKQARIETARKEAIANAADSPHFGAVAVRYSEDQTTRYQGGDFGYVVEGMTDPSWDKAFLEVLFGLETPGQISDVLETSDGLYLVKLIELAPESLKPFGKVNAQIRSTLIREKQKEATSAEQRSVAEGVETEVDTKAIARIRIPQSSDEGSFGVVPPGPARPAN